MQRRVKIPTFAKFAFPPALLPPESVLLLRRICKLPPCRWRSSASGSKSPRTALYCRQSDSAAALLPSVQPDYLVAQAFGLADFYPPLCFVKFIGYVRAGPATFRVGPVGQMEGIRFHLCASPQSYVCAEGLAVADEFHVPQSFRLATAIVPRRRKSLLGVNSVPHPALAVSCSMEQHPCTGRRTGTCGWPSAECAGSDVYSDTACSGKGGRPRSA